MIKHDDLFKDTTMTFGEHLDELRVCLFKAVVGLAIGVAIGLYFGDRVVHVIQAPLEQALAVYYEDNGLKRYESWAAERAAHKPDPLPVPYTQEQLKALVKNEGLLFDIMLIDPQQAVAEAQQHMRNWDAAVQASAVGIAPTTADAATTKSSTAAPEAPIDSSEKLPEGSPAKGAKDEEPPLSPEAVQAGLEIRQRLTPIFVFHPVNEDARIRAKAMGITETFSIWLKASLVLGVVISSPWVFFQIWSFVAAGLYPHEKKYVYMFMPFSLGLFLAGAATAYWFVFAPVLNFLLSYNTSLHIDPEPRIGEWLGFVLLLPLGFGVSFQLPLVMLFLERIGIFSVRAYIDKWRIAVLVIFVISAVLTPADPYSILFMACPLTLLYFGGMLLCQYLPRAGGSGPLDEAPGR